MKSTDRGEEQVVGVFRSGVGRAQNEEVAT